MIIVAGNGIGGSGSGDRLLLVGALDHFRRSMIPDVTSVRFWILPPLSDLIENVVG